jgi:hypothetical protein
LKEDKKREKERHATQEKSKQVTFKAATNRKDQV